jgi:GNAT superfamily N-acetyltransferase
MEVRPLEASEAELFHAFRLRGLRECPEAFGSTFEEESVMPPETVRGRFPCAEDNFVLGAFDREGRLVGVAGFYREKHLKVRHTGVVWGMYVEPAARGRGVGKALLAAVVGSAQGLEGLERVVLDVVVGVEAARRLYLSQGFRAYAVEERAMKQDGAYYDLEHMVLELT